MKEATAWFYTHYDCPHCHEIVETEGDTREEIITCDACNKKFKGV